MGFGFRQRRIERTRSWGIYGGILPLGMKLFRGSPQRFPIAFWYRPGNAFVGSYLAFRARYDGPS